jgi:hypothetical protein
MCANHRDAGRGAKGSQMHNMYGAGNEKEQYRRKERAMKDPVVMNVKNVRPSTCFAGRPLLSQQCGELIEV